MDSRVEHPIKRGDRDRSEKITINVGPVDLGEIDLLVDEGFFANRTDFIRSAVRRQLDSRSGAVQRTVARRALTLASEHYIASSAPSPLTRLASMLPGCPRGER